MNIYPVKVLLIEDASNDADLIRQILNEAAPTAFQLSVADRLSAAEEHLSQHKVDVILVDLFLPDSTGLNTLARVQAAAAGVTVIVLTGIDDHQLGIEAVNLGAQDCLVKGQITGELLRRTIRHSVERTHNAQRLQESEQKFRSVIEQTVDGIVLTDEDGMIIEWNHAQEVISGVPYTETIGQPIWDVFHQLAPSYRKSPAHYETLKRTFVDLLKNGQPPLLGREIQRPTGEIRTIQSSISPIQMTKGYMVSILTRDVTEQQHAQQALEESFLFLQHTLDALSANIAILDKTGTIIAVNEAWRKFADTNNLNDPTYCLGTNYLALCEATTGSDIETAQTVATGIRQALAGNDSDFSLEYQCHSPEQQRWFIVQLHCFEITGSQRVVVEHYDITERKLAEEAFSTERNLLRTLIDHMPDRIYAKDRASRYLIKNAFDALQMGASSPDEVIGKTDFDYYPHDLAERYHADDQMVINLGQPLINREEPTMTADGEQYWILTTKVPLRNKNNEIIGLVGIGRDITERKRTDEQIRKLHAEINALYTIGKQLTQTLDLETIYRAFHAAIVNHVACDGMYISSYSPEDQLIRCVWAWGDGNRLDASLFPPIPLAEEGKGNQSTVIRTGEPLYLPDYQDQLSTSQTLYIVRDDGSIAGRDTAPEEKKLPQSALFVPLKLENRVMGVAQVFSYRLNAYSEDNLRFLKTLAPQATAAMANALLYQQAQHEVSERKQVEAALRELNESLECRIVERTAELSKSEARYRAIVEDQTELICRLLPDTTISFVNEAYCRFFDISREHVLGHSFKPYVFEEDRAHWEQQYATLSPATPTMTLEHRLLAADGRIHWVQWTNRLIESEKNAPIEIQAVGRDITHQKQTEEVLRQALTHEMDVNEMRSRFISMASHDLRTPLAIIQVSIEMLEQYGERLAEERRRTKYDEIRQAIRQMVTLLDNILIIGRADASDQRVEPEPLNLKTFCQTLITELKTEFGSNHRLTLTIEGECEGIWLDPRLLRHIIGNLISNGIKYSPAGSTVAMDLRCTGEQVWLSIKDQGIGIPLDDQKHLFETFFRASNVSKIPGTGLGLAIVRQLVELHGGNVTFESQPGEGTTFSVVLPSIPLKEMDDENDSNR